MAEKTIMLVCSAGMSTSLLVTKMETAAEVKKGQNQGMRVWRRGWRGKKVLAA